MTTDLKGTLSSPVEVHQAAITDPYLLGGLLRAIDDYSSHPYAVAALKLSPLVFLRPGELRSAKWSEINLDAAEWRIPAEKKKLRIEHRVPLSLLVLEILRSVNAIIGCHK